MIEKFSDYWTLFRQYANPAYVLFQSLLWMGVWFAVALVAMLLLRKKVLVRRQYKGLRVLAFAWFIVVPFAAAIFGFKWGIIRGVHLDLRRHSSIYAKAIDYGLSEQLKADLPTFWTDLERAAGSNPGGHSVDDAIDKLGTLVYKNYGDVWEEAAKSEDRTSALFAGFMIKLTRGKAAAWATKKAVRKVFEKTLLMEKDDAKAAMRAQLDDPNPIEGGLATKILQLQFDRFFGSAEKGVVVTFALLLLIPATEIGLAHWLCWRAAHRSTTAIR